MDYLRFSVHNERRPVQRCGTCRRATRYLRVLVFKRTGAYSFMEGMALFLSHALPSVVSYDGSEGWKVLRKQQDTWGFNMPEQNNDNRGGILQWKN